MITVALTLLCAPTRAVVLGRSAQEPSRGIAPRGVTVRRATQGSTSGVLVSIDTDRVVVLLENGSRVTIPMSDVIRIELEAVSSVEVAPTPLPPSESVGSSALDTLPPEFTVWVIDGDSRFSAGTYHTKDCAYLGGHTPRPVQFKDLPAKPKPIPDRCVERLLAQNKANKAVNVAELVKVSAIPPDTYRPPPLTHYGVTSTAYFSINVGMTYFQIQELIGQSGEEMSSSEFGNVTTEMYVWKNDDGGSITGIFRNNRLVSKSQFGLK